MKNFGVRYPVDGTSALQPKFAHTPSGGGTIIEFPGSALQGACAGRDAERRRTLDSELVRSLRFGSARGRAYGCIARWQAAVAGVVFAAAALLVLLLGS